MAKWVADRPTLISATILLFIFWLFFILVYTLFFYQKFSGLENISIIVSSLMIYLLIVSYLWKKYARLSLGQIAAKKSKHKI